MMPTNFKLNQTIIAGVQVLERIPKVDNRGSFERLFCSDELKDLGFNGNIRQVNRSITQKSGAVRGMHFQVFPYSEWKVVSCMKGRVYDVVVDLRAFSKTFLRWISIELTEMNSESIIIPPGCAHGFQTLCEKCEMLYFHSCIYTPEAEGGIRTDDPMLNIKWLLTITERSLRDSNHPFLPQNYSGLQI